MEPLAAQQPTMAAGDPPRATEQAERHCVLFGWVEAAWIVSDPQGGELPACEADLDVLLNDAFSRVPLDSSVRVEVWRA
jgi:hypothetical protein